MNTDSNIKKDPLTSHDENMGISFNESRGHETIAAKPTPNISHDIDPKKSHLTDHHVFDVTRAFSDDHLEAGTIVSDKKRHKATFKENLFSAFSEMWGNTKGSVTSKVVEVAKITERKKEEPALIQKVESRAEVVKEAATYSTIAPKNDHRVAIEKARTFSQDVARLTGTPFTVKPEDRTAKSWTHVEDTKKSQTDEAAPHKLAMPDLRGTMVAPVVSTRINTEVKNFVPPKPIEQKPIHIPLVTPVKQATGNALPKFQVPATVEKKEIPLTKTAVQAAPLVKPEIKPKATFTFSPIPNVPQKATEHTSSVPPKPSIVVAPPAPKVVIPPPPSPLPQVPLVTPTSVPQPEFRTPQPPVKEVEPIKKTASIYTPPSVVKYTPPTASTPSIERDTLRSILRWAILVGIVILGIVLAIALTMYLNARSSNPTPSGETITIPVLFETNAQIPVAFTGDGEAFLAALKAQVDAASGIVQFYPTISDERGVRTLNAAELLTLLGAHLPEKTQRALDEHLMIGSITTSKNEPFIIIRSYNFDILFSGMLAWETSLYTDFAPLFGSAYTGPMLFTDAIQNNKSIRILRDTSGNEILVYSFINQNTVVITTSTEALAQVVSQF